LTPNRNVTTKFVQGIIHIIKSDKYKKGLINYLKLFPHYNLIDVEGVIAPVLASIVKPAVELYVPPEVPVLVTACPAVSDLQKGVPTYDIVAAFGAVTVNVFDAVAAPQLPPFEVKVKVTVPV
jgi:hypothetical protein